MGLVFLRYDIGIPSESLSAKMERVLASLQVQSYKAKKGYSKFFANLWRFEMLKSAHSPSVYREKLFFCIAKVCRFQGVTFGKSDTSCEFND